MRDRAPDGAELERAAEMFRAAGDPARLRLLEHLAVGEASVSELADLARQGLSTVSQQLRVLHQAGLVKRRREGKHVYYRPAASGPGCHTDVDCPERSTCNAETRQCAPARREAGCSAAPERTSTGRSEPSPLWLLAALGAMALGAAMAPKRHRNPSSFRDLRRTQT